MATTYNRLIVAVLLVIACYQPTHAAGFTATRLIEDGTFTNNSMTAGQIQQFLVSKNSVLAKTRSEQLGDGANGRSAAQIIYDATRGSRTDFATGNGFGPRHPLLISVNPQVILVTLQKEQSLITGRYPLDAGYTQRALRFAMGYGCPDDSGCAESYSGFTSQVVYASAQLARNTQLASRSQYPPGRISVFHDQVGRSTAHVNVRVANAATSALYQYTPHVYFGNYNFYNFMNTWFLSQRTYVA